MRPVPHRAANYGGERWSGVIENEEQALMAMKVRKAVFPAEGLGTRSLPAHQGAAETNAASHRQADHSVRRGRGGTFGLRPDHHGDPPRQEQHRRSLRRRRATSWGSSKRRWSSPSSATILAMTFAKYLEGVEVVERFRRASSPTPALPPRRNPSCCQSPRGRSRLSHAGLSLRDFPS